MKHLICLWFICISFQGYGQGFFKLMDDGPLSLKFELVNNIILIPVKINGVPLTFLLDTGVKETILFAQADDSLMLKNQNKMRFHGIGTEGGVEGILSKGNTVEVGDVAIDSLHWLYVIHATDLDLSSDIGVAINGIIGSKFFNSFAVKIDYIKEKITLFPPGYDYTRIIRRYRAANLQVENERPYVQVRWLADNEWMAGKVLLDLGNTDPIMLFPFVLKNHVVRSPYVEEYIGRGFNGVIYGKRNRIRKVVLEDFTLDYPIVAYPDSNAVFLSKLARNRVGSIGSQVVQRFHILIDYERRIFYLDKNRHFKKPFLMNMAGVDIKHDGIEWVRELVSVSSNSPNERSSLAGNNEIKVNLSNSGLQYKFVLKAIYKISGLRKNSPAANAGVCADDILLKINGMEVGNLTLSKINSKLQSHPGDTLKLTLKRNEKVFTTTFRLVDPIPY
ncbi:PDZ domain-containing protein [Sphingobacterium sp. LRF_L2]|uniref:PDZ domain-containing protein n=1 Tax=Sphingobacterium sp. LRF_L2 TaxID=3369421 RepID=UPI003F5DF356